ncbi:hypothetical protein CNMCM5793_004874 [Aspergillus hiratsukae]|uniref:Uncharacterized protein n=1 Tax=Aspergillus hiratsukae TaxID=1194566 RepID=A0A8H6NZS4_9EURO|nr:hypothetical protein CNMCM5793_004874 [Aspergillus hiratsukae]KAF7173091.1 hypothetical protein CNMCM6106_007244 [Aspergillus hiratsukae]
MSLHKLLLLIFLTFFASAVPFDSQRTNTQLIFFQPSDPQPAHSDPGNPHQDDLKRPEVQLALDDSSCSKWYEFYGKGKWTFTKVQWCFQQKGSTTVIIQEQAEAQYMWGPAWYYAKNETLSWKTSGNVGNKNFDSGKDSNDGTAAKKQIAEIKPGLHPGKSYTVRLNYYQEGPYWDAKNAIDEEATFEICLC